MNFTSVKNNKKTINLKNKNKNYEVNAQWLYEPVSYTHLTLPTTPYV